MRLTPYAICATLLAIVGCSSAEDEDRSGAAESASTANRVDCDVRYDILAADQLAGIRIEEPTRFPISPQDKRRHLNELNRTSPAFLGVLRTKNLAIALTGGTIPSFPQYAGLHGVVPPGWEKTGLTWDSVPGMGNETGLFLGNPAYPNNAWSLAIHEGAHAVDLGSGLGVKSSELIALYNAELARPVNAADQNSTYRRSNIHEFFAVAADEYFCSAKTQTYFAYYYPEMYAFIRTRLDHELRAAMSSK